MKQQEKLLNEKINEVIYKFDGETKLGVPIIETRIENYEDVVVVKAIKSDSTIAVFSFFWTGVHWIWLSPKFTHLYGLQKIIESVHQAEYLNKKNAGK